MTSPLLAAFEQQVAWCTRGGAPFTARVLARSSAWLARTPDAHAALAALSTEPLQAAVALRWAAALHWLALQGLQPWAGLWARAAQCTGSSDAAADLADDTFTTALDAAVALAWQAHQGALHTILAHPPQTNEVQRSAALLPGLLHIAQRTGRPLVLLEIGASSGLNLWCDRYRHAPMAADGELAWAWGDPAAPLALRAAWSGPVPWAPAAEPPPLQVLHRAACDALPVDLRDPAQALRGASYIWPDQPARLARLRAAQAAAARWMEADDVAVQAQPAGDFVAAALQRPAVGAATVLMHSVVWQYIAPQEQDAIRAAVEAAARRATAQAPLAWLRLEPPRADLNVELRCQLWPGGADTLLATTHPHGASVHWLAGGTAP